MDRETQSTITHRMLIVFATVALFVMNLIGSPAFSDDRPNVVWIIADDLSPDLGCCGYDGISTPNLDRLAAQRSACRATIGLPRNDRLAAQRSACHATIGLPRNDRLAAQGARYTGAFATAPVCSASRSALITGVYQTTTGTHQHRTLNKQPLPKPFEPITELMRRAGHLVSNGNSEMNKPGKADYNFKFNGKMYDAPDWSQRKKAKEGTAKGERRDSQATEGTKEGTAVLRAGTDSRVAPNSMRGSSGPMTRAAWPKLTNRRPSIPVTAGSEEE